MLTEGEHFNVPDHHHLIMVLVKYAFFHNTCDVCVCEGTGQCSTLKDGDQVLRSWEVDVHVVWHSQPLAKNVFREGLATPD